MIQKTALALNKTQILEVIYPKRQDVLENYKHEFNEQLKQKIKKSEGTAEQAYAPYMTLAQEL